VQVFRAPFSVLPKTVRRKLIPVIEEAFGARIHEIVEVATSAGVLKFYGLSPIVRYRIDSFHEKEPETLAWIDEFGSDDVMWDIGANIGLYSLYAARHGIRVVAFEPGAANFSLLTSHIALNEFSSLIDAYCLALSDEDGLGVLEQTSAEPGGAHAQFVMAQAADRNTSKYRQGIIGMTLDGLAGRKDLPFPTHLKIDVDGIEEKIFNGARQTLMDSRLRSIVVELDECDPEGIARVQDLIQSVGFAVEKRVPAEMNVRPAHNRYFNWHCRR